LNATSCEGLKTKENKKMHFIILGATDIQMSRGQKNYLILRTIKMGGNCMVEKYL
jgi:hypothetical protein